MQKDLNIRFGIRTKILTVLLSILLIAITVSGWFALQEERKNTLAEHNQRGQDISRFVAKSLSYSVIGYDYHMIQLLLDDIVSTNEIQYAEVINKEKRSMGKSGALGKTNNENLIIFNEDILLDDSPIGTLTMVLSTEKIIQRIESQKNSLVTREILIIVLISTCLFIALSIIIISPVNIITQSMDNAIDDTGKIMSEINISSNDEFGHLAQKFNELGAELNHANDQLQKKIEVADEKLIFNNQQLTKQAEELKKVNDELRQISITDALTGLYNRRHFEDLLSMELNMSRRHGDQNGMLLIDIDFFKAVNDNYGHISGDLVLKSVADCLTENIRKTDVLCRIGGEEFVVLCKRTSKENLEIVATKLRCAIEKLLIPINGQMVKVTISVGGATVPNKKIRVSVDEFYRQADNALYFCKEHGRNQYIHYKDIRIN